MENNWYNFYKTRINSKEYLEHFQTYYAPFLDEIKKVDFKKFQAIVEEGCGIGNVTKALNVNNFLKDNDIDCVLIDNSTEMLNATIENLLTTNLSLKFIIADILKMRFVQSSLALTVTHGVLEHFSNLDLISYFYDRRAFKQIHYVPLIKHEIPSYGDERLLTVDYWQDLIKMIYYNCNGVTTEFILFNDDKDLIIKIN